VGKKEIGPERAKLEAAIKTGSLCFIFFLSLIWFTSGAKGKPG
jgi:hypothetical protein